MIGQIQLSNVKDTTRVIDVLQNNVGDLIEDANSIIPNLIERGGGVRRMEYRRCGI